MANITHNAIISYLKDLSEKCLDINDFFRMDISEIEGALRTGIDFPVMVAESHEGNYDGSGHHNSLEKKLIAFSILNQTRLHDFDGQNLVLDATEIIGKKVLARMRLDSTEPGHFLNGLFDLGMVNFHKVGPLYADLLYGYRFEIHLKPQKVDVKVNPADWSDLETVC